MPLAGLPLPREHGAYGQMAVPMLTALVLTRAHAESLLFAVAAVAGFLLHEPVVILLGRRGARAVEAEAGRARVWGAVWAAVFVVASALAVRALGDRWLLAVLPAVPALVLFDAAVRGTERSALAQTAAAAGFAATAAPMLAVAHLPWTWQWLVPGVLAANSIVSTLAVRSVVARARVAVDPQGAGQARFLVVLAALVVGALAGWLHLRRLIGPYTFAACLPAVAMALVLVARPPRPQQLRRVGWALALGTLTTATLLVTGLLRL